MWGLTLPPHIFYVLTYFQEQSVFRVLLSFSLFYVPSTCFALTGPPHTQSLYWTVMAPSSSSFRSSVNITVGGSQGIHIYNMFKYYSVSVLLEIIKLIKSVCVKLPVTTVLVLQFRSCGTIPPHHNTASWNLQGQLLLCLLIEYFLKVSKFAQAMYHGCVPLAMPK